MPKGKKETLIALGIDPDFKYTLAGFYQSSGIGKKTVMAAAKRGVELPKKRIGRRVYVDGADAIAFLDQLAELPQPICG